MAVMGKHMLNGARTINRMKHKHRNVTSGPQAVVEKPDNCLNPESFKHMFSC